MIFGVETERDIVVDFGLTNERSRRARLRRRGPLFRPDVETGFSLEADAAGDKLMEVVIPEGREYWDAEDSITRDTGGNDEDDAKLFTEAPGVEGGVENGLLVT